MQIQLESNVEKLEKEIETLKRAIYMVISSPEFRSLFGKTQFLDADEIKGLNQNGNEDEEWTDRRTRGDHTLMVAGIAEDFVEKVYMDAFEFEEVVDKNYGEEITSEQNSSTTAPTMVLKDGVDKNNSEYIIYSLNKERAKLLARLSGYAHDLGHTPFGHDGEDAVSEIYQKYQEKQSEEERIKNRKCRRQIFGKEYEESLGHTKNFNGISSFEHIEQSYINFLNIINREGIKFSKELLESVKFSILSHSRSRVKSLPTHVKSQDRLVMHAIRTADKVDYQITDGYEMEKLITLPESKLEYADKSKSIYEKINSFIDNWTKEIEENEDLSDDMEVINKLKKYRNLYEMWAILYCEIADPEIGKLESIERMEKKLSRTPIGVVGMFKGNKTRNKCIIKKLLTYYLEHYEEIPETRKLNGNAEEGYIDEEKIRQEQEKKNPQLNPDTKSDEAFNKAWWESIDYPKEWIAIGFITSLTNIEARNLYNQLVDLRIQKGPGYGIEPIKKEEIDSINREYTLQYIKKMYELISPDNLSLSERKNLENKLRNILRENNAKLYQSITVERGVQVAVMVKQTILNDIVADKKSWESLEEADAERGEAQTQEEPLKYPNILKLNTEDGENPGDTGDGR